MPASSTVPARRPVAFAGHPHRQRRLLAQPVRHAGGELLVDMLDDDDRRRKVLRQAAQHRRERRRPAGGRADRDQRARAGPRGARAPQRVAPALGRSPISRAIVAIFASSGAARLRVIAASRAAGVSTASSAPWPIASKTRAGVARHAGGDDQDRAGRARP